MVTPKVRRTCRTRHVRHSAACFPRPCHDKLGLVTVWQGLLAMAIFWGVVVFVVRVIPVIRRGRVVVLDRPRATTFSDAQHACDRLIAAGFDAEVVEHEDSGLNVWANGNVAGEVRPDVRYVVQVPRNQAKSANAF